MVARPWPSERHGTLGNPHVYRPIDGDPRNDKRCGCGRIEILDGLRDELYRQMVTDCSERGCQREAGHAEQHMARWWDAQAGLEVNEAWDSW